MASKKNQISRRKFLALTGLTVAGGIAAACTGAPAPTSAPAATQPSTEGGAATEATEPAEPVTQPSGQLVAMRYVFPNSQGQLKDIESVQKALDEITTARINATVKLDYIDWGAWDDKIQLINAGGEQYDVAYTANWTNDYYKNVANGVFVELDDLLPTKAPNYWASMPVTTWNAAKVKGKLYAAINQQMFPKTWGFLARKDMAEKYALDLSKVKKWQDIEGWLDAVKKGEPEIIPFGNPMRLYVQEIYGNAPVDDGVGWLQVKGTDTSAKVENYYENADYAEAWDLTRKWYDAGYMPKEEVPGDQMRANWKAGKHVIDMNPVTKPKGEYEAQAILGHEVVLKSLSPAILTTPGITATMTGVSRTSVDTSKAAEWLELVNTDKVVYNLLCVGIEDKHWKWKDQGKEVIEQIPDTGYNPTTDWMFGNQFMAYYRDENQVGSWEETKKINDSATPSPTLGFVMDREPVKNEIAAIGALLEEYTPYGQKGIPASDLPKVVQQMKDAGADRVKDEMQKQIDLWKQGG